MFERHTRIHRSPRTPQNGIQPFRKGALSPASQSHTSMGRFSAANLVLPYRISTQRRLAAIAGTKNDLKLLLAATINVAPMAGHMG